LGQAYLAAVAVFNDAGCLYNGVVGSPQARIEELQAAASRQADASRVFADALRAIPFPPPLDEPARSVIESTASAESYLRSAAAATDYDEVVTHINNAFTAYTEGAAASNLLRGDLGLPSVSGGC
jgi:hypothetical protein